MIGETEMKKTFLIASILLVAASVSAKHYPDSIMQASKEEPHIAYGWNFEFSGGLGAGSYEYKQLFAKWPEGYDRHITNKVNFPAWNAAIGINYYFVSWMGIGTGVEFGAYTNNAAVTKAWTANGIDKYGDDYTITAQPTNLSEYQNIYMLEVPIALKFRARPGVVGFTATAGVKLGFPMMNNYKLGNNGTMNNSVRYDLWDLTLQDVPTVIEDVSIPSQGKQQMEKTAFKMLNYAAYAEIGMLIRLHQRIELALSAYANYYFTDVLTHETPAYGTTELGFGVSPTVGEYTMPYNTDYNGVLRTKEVVELHPWSVGLKIGIQINANRTKAQREWDKEQRKKKPVEPEPEQKDTVPEVVESAPVDTIPTPAPEPEPDPRELAIQQIREIAERYNIDLCKEFCVSLHDTVSITGSPEMKDSVAAQLNEALKRSVIYFDLDKAEPILKPEDILVRIAEVLKRHPDQKIHINGHACKLGKPEYNKRLSLRRANAVADQLRSLGVKNEQMIIASLGSEVPFRYNGQHQLAKDRRVEIVPAERTTEVVRPGSRLAQIARRHYGETEYWVFIYEANRDKIKDPSDLPIGLELDIPDLSERLKNMTETQAMNEALRLKEEIMKNRKK